MSGDPPLFGCSLLSYHPTVRRDEVITVLKRHEREARALGVRSLYLFGSAARDEAREDSDIDLFIDPDYERLGFVELFRLEQRLADLLGRSVELSTRARDCTP